MKKNLIINLILILTGISIYAQVDDVSQKIEFYEKSLFDINHEIFSDHNLEFEKRKFYFGPWDDPFINEPDELEETLDTIINNAALSIKDHYLQFKSHFSEYVDQPFRFKLQLIESNIKDKNNKKAIINVIPQIDYELETLPTSDESTYRKKVHFKANYEIKNSLINYKGSLKFTASFVDGFNYEYKKIRNQDIGKEFQFNGSTFKVVAIKSNFLVLYPYSSGAGSELEFLNLDKEEKNIYEEKEPLDFSEDIVEKEIDIDNKVIIEPRIENASVSKMSYEIFEKNPKITFLEFKKLIHNDVVKSFQNKDKSNDLTSEYIIIKSAGPIESCYIYLAKYSIKKEFELKLN